jgi:hypothetical protein
MIVLISRLLNFIKYMIKYDCLTDLTWTYWKKFRLKFILNKDSFSIFISNHLCCDWYPRSRIFALNTPVFRFLRSTRLNNTTQLPIIEKLKQPVYNHCNSGNLFGIIKLLFSLGLIRLIITLSIFLSLHSLHGQHLLKMTRLPF